MPLPDKVMDLAGAMAAVRPGTRLMMGEFVGAGEPARCVQWLLDAGIAMCWKADTGNEIWKSRLGGTFSASPVLLGDTIFATNEAGRTFIFKATPEAFALVAENQFGDEVLATPALCGGRIYLRVATRNKGQRQEVLACLGKGE